MTTVKDRLKAHRLRAAREGKPFDEAAMKAVVARSKKMDGPLQREGFGGRGREVAAIERHRLIAINLRAAPFEWLSSKGFLETKADRAGIGSIRFSAGMNFRDLLVGAEPTALKSANLEGRSGGGGVPIIITDFKLDCVTEVNRIRAELERVQPRRWGKLMMPTGHDKTGKPKKAWIAERYQDERPTLFGLLERLIYCDEWVFEKLPRHRHKAVMAQLHLALDVVACTLGMITDREFFARWNRRLW